MREEETELFQFDPRARADMIDRALQENCHNDTEPSEFDPSQDDTHEILKDLDGSSSQRDTQDQGQKLANAKLIAETYEIMKSIKSEMHAKEQENGGANAEVIAKMQQLQNLLSETDLIRNSESPRIQKQMKK